MQSQGLGLGEGAAELAELGVLAQTVHPRVMVFFMCEANG
jgi:hypothetical protein